MLVTYSRATRPSGAGWLKARITVTFGLYPLGLYPVSDYIQFFEGYDFLPDHFLAEYFKKFILYLALNEHVELNNCKVKSPLQYEITFTE